MKRFQARRSGGRFTRNTPENTLGMHIDVCSSCGALNPWELGAPPPEACHGCSAVFIRERCAHGRCTEAFMDPDVFLSGGYDECGKPAVAVDLVWRWGVCAAHLQGGSG